MKLRTDTRGLWNILFSFSPKEDFQYEKLGYTFLGAGGILGIENEGLGEIHVWRRYFLNPEQLEFKF